MSNDRFRDHESLALVFPPRAEEYRGVLESGDEPTAEVYEELAPTYAKGNSYALLSQLRDGKEKRRQNSRPRSNGRPRSVRATSNGRSAAEFALALQEESILQGRPMHNTVERDGRWGSSGYVESL